jgi:hypothetical protein
MGSPASSRKNSRRRNLDKKMENRMKVMKKGQRLAQLSFLPRKTSVKSQKISLYSTDNSAF